MTTYGQWRDPISIDGQRYPADLIDQRYAERAGYAKIYAVNGIPPRFERDLIRASQVCDAPHTWRVRECKSEDEVTEEDLRQGKIVLDEDRAVRRAHVFTYLGDKDGSGQNFEFLAAGAIRDKLTKDYQNELFPVVSRAIVAPSHRGRGLGTLIVEHRMKAVFHYFGKVPKAIHFGTESKKILHAVHKVEHDEDIKFVYIGDERYTAADGTHTVHDFLCFLPWYQKRLMEACDRLRPATKTPEKLDEFKEKLELFVLKGVEAVSGDTLEKLFNELRESVQTQDSDSKAAIEELAEVFFIRGKIGAADPR